MRWHVYAAGTFVADRQDNRLRLDASGGTGTAAVLELPLITRDPEIARAAAVRRVW